ADVVSEGALRAEGLRNRFDHQRVIAERGEADPEDTALVLRDEGERGLQREPGLPRAAWAGHRSEPRAGFDHGEDCTELLRPPKKGARRPGEVCVGDRAEWRKGAAPKLVHPFGSDQILEAVVAEVAELGLDQGSD